MREIKFRYVWGRPKAWSGPYRPDDPKVIITYITLEDLEKRKPFKPPWDLKKTPIPSTYSILIARNEFTGLLDKNGVDIYEGDILDVDTENRRVKVVWFESQACFDTDVVEIIDKTWPFFQALQNSHWGYRCEVIGNIYENPELVKK